MTISYSMKMAESPPNGLKTLRENEKLLVTDNSPFPTVFSKDLLSRHVESSACFGKG